MRINKETKLTGSEVLEIINDILDDVEAKAIEQSHGANRDMAIAYSTQVSLCVVIKFLLDSKVH